MNKKNNGLYGMLKANTGKVKRKEWNGKEEVGSAELIVGLFRLPWESEVCAKT